MQWVKHDTDANQDAKLQNVLLDYGLEGYGLYWYCIELIAGKVDKDNITFELEHDARIIARNVGSTPQKVEEMMRYFVKLGLFENHQGVITCLKIAKRLDQSMTSNHQMREIIKNFKQLQNHDEVMTNHDEVMKDKIRLEENREETNNKDQRIEDAFNEIFWPAYHKKSNKAGALKSFKATVKREGIKEPKEFAEMLVNDCRDRIKSNQLGFDNLHASTYLNNNRWEDEKQSEQVPEKFERPEWMRGIK